MTDKTEAEYVFFDKDFDCRYVAQPYGYHSYVVTLTICLTCGLLAGDPKLHVAWHLSQGESS